MILLNSCMDVNVEGPLCKQTRIEHNGQYWGHVHTYRTMLSSATHSQHSWKDHWCPTPFLERHTSPASPKEGPWWWATPTTRGSLFSLLPSGGRYRSVRVHQTHKQPHPPGCQEAKFSPLSPLSDIHQLSECWTPPSFLPLPPKTDWNCCHYWHFFCTATTQMNLLRNLCCFS